MGRSESCQRSSVARLRRSEGAQRLAAAGQLGALGLDQHHFAAAVVAAQTGSSFHIHRFVLLSCDDCGQGWPHRLISKS